MDYMSMIFIGKVKEQPQIRTGEDGKKQAFLTLIVVTDRVKESNGQWVDKITEVPVFATDKQADTIEQYVVAGQELRLDCSYVNTPEEWKRWTIKVNFVKLGYKPKNTQPKAASGIPV
jgi:hypothetical protein